VGHTHAIHYMGHTHTTHYLRSHICNPMNEEYL